MKIMELMNKVNVKNIGIRLCKTESSAKDCDYKNTSLKYWGSLDDCPAEFAQYKICRSKVKSHTLFCWCIKDSITVKDILAMECSSTKIKYFNYISEYDSKLKDHVKTIEVPFTVELLDCEVIDTVISEDYAEIYIFRDNIKSNIFDNNFDTNRLKFEEFNN